MKVIMKHQNIKWAWPDSEQSWVKFGGPKIMNQIVYLESSKNNLKYEELG